MFPAKNVKESPVKDVIGSPTKIVKENSSKDEENSQNLLKITLKTETAFGEEKTIFPAEETVAPLDIPTKTSEPDFCLHKNMAPGEKDSFSSEGTLDSPESLAILRQGFSAGTSHTFSDLNEPSTSKVINNVSLSDEPRGFRKISTGLTEQLLDLHARSISSLDEKSAFHEETQVSQSDEFLEPNAKSISSLNDSMLPFEESLESQARSVETPESTSVETQVPLHSIAKNRAQEYQPHTTETSSTALQRKVPVQYVEKRKAEEYQLHTSERASIPRRGGVIERHVKGGQSLRYRLRSTESVPTTQPGESPVRYDEHGQSQPIETVSIAQRGLQPQRQVKRNQAQQHALHSIESITQPKKFLKKTSIQHSIGANKPAGKKSQDISAVGTHVPLSTSASSPKPALVTGETVDKGGSHTSKSVPRKIKVVHMCEHCKKCFLQAGQYKLDCPKHGGNSSRSESLTENNPAPNLGQLLETNYQCFICDAKFSDIHSFKCHLKCKHRLNNLTLCEKCKKTFR